MARNPKILLIVGGGIAAYKSCELIRMIRKAGGDVICVVTEGGQQFVTPMALAALSENPVYTSLWDLKNEAEMGHIQLSREADLLVVCPATADLLAKMAAGIADDLATTLLLATDTPVLAVPAMNVRMWEAKATQRNVGWLRAAAVEVMEPDQGAMACGEFGAGRLPEVEAIWAAIAKKCANFGIDGIAGVAGVAGVSGATGDTGAVGAGASDPLLGQPDFESDPAHRPLYGRHVLVTAGPTHEPIDPVRYIANRSSGRQGFAIAAAAAAAGARVTLVSGPVILDTPPGVERVDVESARDMEAAVQDALPADAAIMVAAVADWRSKSFSQQKIKKQAQGQGRAQGQSQAGGPASEPAQETHAGRGDQEAFGDRDTPDSSGGAQTLELTENPDILANLAGHAARPPLLIGFAAETQNVIQNAQAKLARKQVDWIIANDVSGDVMGGDHNQVHIVRGDAVESLSTLPKEDVARELIARVAQCLEKLDNE